MKDHQKIVGDTANIMAFTQNTNKNRYQNIVLYDATRVLLKQKTKGDSAYIHASRSILIPPSINCLEVIFSEY
ncbi:MAG: hypothetical protein GY696_00270 [Gammaproteobacteria bacterium]|nr:hypothetical protein [Gammaproteobacteria bacterium]